MELVFEQSLGSESRSYDVDQHMADFFVSYTSADKAWAEWIGYVLEEEGFAVDIQVWDFRPGNNFVLEMQRAATEADRTIMVLSPDYLKSQFASPEWAAAFAQDPQGLKRKLVPIMVRQCQPSRLLSSVVHISLMGEEESAARGLLLNGLNAKRAKPDQRPSFPGSAAGRPHKSFPGPATSGGTSPAPYVPNLKRSPTDADRRRRRTMVLLGPSFIQDVAESFLVPWQPVTVLSLGKSFSILPSLDAASWSPTGPSRTPVGLAVVEEDTYICTNGGPSPQNYFPCFVNVKTGAIVEGRLPSSVAFTNNWEIAALAANHPPRAILKYPLQQPVAQLK